MTGPAAPPGGEPRRYPFLERWHAELAAGTRSPTTFDWLWRAAARERLAHEHFALGYYLVAGDFLAAARAAAVEGLGRRSGAAK